MKLLEKILVATDLGPATQGILQMATFLARAYHSSVVLLHVVPEIPGSPFSMDMLVYVATSKLREVAKDIPEQRAGSVEIKVVFGSAFDRIIDCAEDCRANVILMGSGETIVHEKSHLGITAEKVMRKASKPVWVVKRGAAPSIKRILCPVDFSEGSRRALVNAIQLARTFLAELVVLTVIEPLLYFYPHVPLPDEEFQRGYEAKQQKVFDHFLHDIDFSQVSWKRLIRVGRPHEQILLLAGETQPDLMVMGSVGRTGVLRILMGSVAQKVVREIPCSVITVKSKEVNQDG
jgi:universal stress protein E